MRELGRLPGPRCGPGSASGCPDSNWGPLRPERSALPGCATPRKRRLSHTPGAAQPAPAVARQKRTTCTCSPPGRVSDRPSMPSAPIANVVQMMLTTMGSPEGVPSPNAFAQRREREDHEVADGEAADEQRDERAAHARAAHAARLEHEHQVEADEDEDRQRRRLRLGRRAADRGVHEPVPEQDGDAEHEPRRDGERGDVAQERLAVAPAPRGRARGRRPGCRR